MGWGQAVGGLEWQAEQMSGDVFGTMVLRICCVCVCMCVCYMYVCMHRLLGRLWRVI